MQVLGLQRNQKPVLPRGDRYTLERAHKVVVRGMTEMKIIITPLLELLVVSEAVLIERHLHEFPLRIHSDPLREASLRAPFWRRGS